MSLLLYIFLIPLATALVLVFIPSKQQKLIRSLSVFATLVSSIISIILFLTFDYSTSGLQFEFNRVWIPSLDIRLHFGVDGLNLGLILMGSIVGFVAVSQARHVNYKEKTFHILLLLIIGGILGAFASLDMFFMYALHELALVPSFLMIGIWGRGPRRTFAAFQVTIYLTVGAFIALVGLLLLYVKSGASSFDLIKIGSAISQNMINKPDQITISGLLLLGFGILVSLWPFHSWAPLGYASAPVPTAMLHAGVIKKFGLYALLRIVLTLLPEGIAYWANYLILLALGNILYCGWVAMQQKELDKLLGFSSVAHMGFAFIGIATLNPVGISGSLIIMIAHGFLAALAFGVSGSIQEKVGTGIMSDLGGLLKKMPFLGTALIIAMIAGCGMPGFANFPGELLVFFGGWKAHQWIIVAAVWGALVIGAIYMFRAVRSVLHGQTPDRFSNISDITSWKHRAPFALLIFMLILFGIFPHQLTNKFKNQLETIADFSKGNKAIITKSNDLTP